MFIVISFSVFLISLVVMLSSLLFSVGVNSFSISSWLVISDYFLFDSISFYLVFLVVVLGFYSQVLLYNGLVSSSRVYLGLSLCFTVISFCINHSVIFWLTYELSMLPLLYLIFKDSPYSERFLAGWYFLGYLMVTSLPLILVLLYLSYVNNSFLFSDWLLGDDSLKVVYYLLSFIFFTKVPLFPFHTWLPIVHAEASSIVSIFLSGYIMKLGLLGVYRCTFFVFDINFIIYIFVCCVVSVCFFIVSCSELDGKRWLAFLSLSHIVVPFLCFFVCDWSSISYSFFYCLGHGLSAGIVFGLLWCIYDISNTRNWVLLKSSISDVNFMLIVIVSLLSLCSFPPTVQFFCEVNLIGWCVNILLYILFWFFYLFFGGLVPLILCGHLLIRSEWYCAYSLMYSYFFFLVFLCGWVYLGFVVL
uniref:NADH-ubiquinone oxidoreductase chain 4 n=1 Tax=Hydatigera parva TaxID=1434711 RepID=N0DQW4_9CEST|nr:NADH dehydrogenase subunit 4 [Hydatigera parva]BAN15657.1 NADH dehydrogenase subunit 4 [Hydatigera parva]